MQDSSPGLEAPVHTPVPDAVKVQMLATEHWSLLASRGLIWNETFSRAGMFLTSLSAAVVALALVAQIADFGDTFSIFALLVLPVVLLLGIGTFVRLLDAWSEDMWMVMGMNRLRHAYIDLAPDLEKYFIAGHHDDLRGVMQTYNSGSQYRHFRILVSTPVLVGVVNSVLAGVIVALFAEAIDAHPIFYASVGVATSLCAAALMIRVMASWDIGRLPRGYEPHFPQ